MCLITGLLGFLTVIGGFFGFAFLGVSSTATDFDSIPLESTMRSATATGNYELITVFEGEGSNYFFPRQLQQNAVMEALVFGEFTQQDGCLTVADYVVVWAPGYDLIVDTDGVGIINEMGAIVARTGDSVSLSGGEVPTASFESESSIFPFADCDSAIAGYWLMGAEFQRAQ